ncbi:MAG: hypothetical protein K2W82_03840 [Candidatus Obscuribacterales bacterium]|nr:hypothetical protein [Candidatus Obscuribacterales bacterium]
MSDLKPPANQIEISELLQVSVQAFQERPGLLIGGTAALNIIPAVCVGIPLLVILFLAGAANALTQELSPENAIKFVSILGCGMPLLFLAYAALRVGWISICLKIIQHKDVSFSEFKSSLPYFWSFLAVQFLSTLLIAVGFCLLIVPGIFIAVRLAFAPYLVIDRNLGPIEAMKESWQMVTGYSWQIFWLGVAYCVASTAAGIVPIVGMLAQLMSMSFYDLVLAAAYKARSETTAGGI